jgi:hypothetical protein
MNLPARIIINLAIFFAILILLTSCATHDQAPACRGTAFSINAPAQIQAMK